MGITVNTNVGSLLAQSYLSSNQNKLSQTLNRLSSGLRITEAKDDPAGLAIAESMRSTISGLNQGSRNANDGVSLLQTAQGAMTQTMELLQQMRTLASQASSGTYGSGDLANINTTFTALRGEVDRIQATSTFNGIALLDGGSISIQVGANNTSNDRISVTLAETDTTTLGINASTVDTNSNAQSALDAVNDAIDTLTGNLASLGATQANLEAAVNSNDSFATNLSAARSRITDADYAAESANLAKYMIMSQANVAMLSQANSIPQMALKLLG